MLLSDYYMLVPKFKITKGYIVCAVTIALILCICKDVVWIWFAINKITTHCLFSFRTPEKDEQTPQIPKCFENTSHMPYIATCFSYFKSEPPQFSCSAISRVWPSSSWLEGRDTRDEGPEPVTSLREGL